MKLLQQIIFHESLGFAVVLIDGLVLDEHVGGVVGMVVAFVSGVEEYVGVELVRVGLDDALLGEYVVKGGGGVLVGGLGVSKELVLHDSKKSAK